jgi:plasmid stabilization system protein ParE
VTLRFTPGAAADVREARSWYEAQRDGWIRSSWQTCGRRFERVREFPQAWRPRDEAGLRQYRFRRFPYALIYVTNEDELLVLAVAHLAREPRDWGSADR